MTTKIIENRTVTVEVGSVIVNSAGRTEKLLPSDWERASFRFPNLISEWREKHAIAVNVEITGRTFQWRNGSHYVRVSLEWVNDDDPSTFTGGWMLVNPWECPKVEQLP